MCINCVYFYKCRILVRANKKKVQINNPIYSPFITLFANKTFGDSLHMRTMQV